MSARFIIIIIFIIVFTGCDRPEKKQVSADKIDTLELKPEPLDDSYKLLYQGINQGDTTAYRKASVNMMLRGLNVDVLYYAMVMANKYDYSQAYYDVYHILAVSGTGETLETSGKRTKQIAYFYLLKAYEKGNRNAYYQVKEIFNGNEIPKSTIYRNVQ